METFQISEKISFIQTQSGYYILSMIVIDVEGKKVEMIAYDDVAIRFKDVLQKGKVFQFSKLIKIPNVKYRKIMNLDFKLLITHQTTIKQKKSMDYLHSNYICVETTTDEKEKYCSKKHQLSIVNFLK